MILHDAIVNGLATGTAFESVLFVASRVAVVLALVMPLAIAFVLFFDGPGA